MDRRLSHNGTSPLKLFESYNDSPTSHLAHLYSHTRCNESKIAADTFSQGFETILHHKQLGSAALHFLTPIFRIYQRRL